MCLNLHLHIGQMHCWKQRRYLDVQIGQTGTGPVLRRTPSNLLDGVAGTVVGGIVVVEAVDVDENAVADVAMEVGVIVDVGVVGRIVV